MGQNASWFQNRTTQVIGIGGYSGTLAVTDGSGFIYGGAAEIELNPASNNSGSALLAVTNGAIFTTSRGYVIGSGGTGTGTGTGTGRRRTYRFQYRRRPGRCHIPCEKRLRHADLSAPANTYTGQVNASNETSTVSIASGAFLNLGFVSWPGNFGLNPADLDPADDGIANRLEFFLNGNPADSDNSILPDLNVTATHFEFTYQRRADSLAPETSQVLQSGKDLTGWTDIPIPPASATAVATMVSVTDGSPTDTVKIRIPKDAAGEDRKLFGRLSVTR